MRRGRFVVIAALFACRGKGDASIGATPAAESIDARADAAAGEATVAAPAEVSAESTSGASVDPCEQWGPAIGDACDTPGVVCLSRVDEPLYERRCDGKTWSRHAATRPLSKSPTGPCPTTEPMSGDACSGAFACALVHCSELDPATDAFVGFNAWATTWYCYGGVWRRREERCIGE